MKVTDLLALAAVFVLHIAVATCSVVSSLPRLKQNLITAWEAFDDKDTKTGRNFEAAYHSILVPVEGRVKQLEFKRQSTALLFELNGAIEDNPTDFTPELYAYLKFLNELKDLVENWDSKETKSSEKGTWLSTFQRQISKLQDQVRAKSVELVDYILEFDLEAAWGSKDVMPLPQVHEKETDAKYITRVQKSIPQLMWVAKPLSGLVEELQLQSAQYNWESPAFGPVTRATFTTIHSKSDLYASCKSKIVKKHDRINYALLQAKALKDARFKDVEKIETPLKSWRKLVRALDEFVSTVMSQEVWNPTPPEVSKDFLDRRYSNLEKKVESMMAILSKEQFSLDAFGLKDLQSISSKIESAETKDQLYEIERSLPKIDNRIEQVIKIGDHLKLSFDTLPTRILETFKTLKKGTQQESFEDLKHQVAEQKTFIEALIVEVQTLKPEQIQQSWKNYMKRSPATIIARIKTKLTTLDKFCVALDGFLNAAIKSFGNQAELDVGAATLNQENQSDPKTKVENASSIAIQISETTTPDAEHGSEPRTNSLDQANLPEPEPESESESLVNGTGNVGGTVLEETNSATEPGTDPLNPTSQSDANPKVENAGGIGSQVFEETTTPAEPGSEPGMNLLDQVNFPEPESPVGGPGDVGSIVSDEGPTPEAELNLKPEPGKTTSAQAIQSEPESKSDSESSVVGPDDVGSTTPAAELKPEPDLGTNLLNQVNQHETRNATQSTVQVLDDGVTIESVPEEEVYIAYNALPSRKVSSDLFFASDSKSSSDPESASDSESSSDPENSTDSESSSDPENSTDSESSSEYDGSTNALKLNLSSADDMPNVPQDVFKIKNQDTDGQANFSHDSERDKKDTLISSTSASAVTGVETQPKPSNSFFRLLKKLLILIILAVIVVLVAAGTYLLKEDEILEFITGGKPDVDEETPPVTIDVPQGLDEGTKDRATDMNVIIELEKRS